MSQVYQRFSARGGFFAAGPPSGRMTCSGVRAGPSGTATSKTAPVSAIRLQPFFSPVPARFSKVLIRCSGALVRRRRASGSIATPLPSAESASGGRPCPCPPLPGRGDGGLVPVLVEPLRVRGRSDGDLLQLPLADADPRRGQHELVPLLIRHRPAEHLRQPLQLPGIPQRRQIQHRIAREQRPRALDPGPVRDPPHPHLTQLRHHRPAMTGLGASPRHPVLAGHPRQPDLTPGLGIQGQLNQTTQQLPALPDDQHLHRIQRHRPARLPGQPGQPRRQRPQPRQHRLRASRQIIQPVLFHLRLPFRSPGFASQDHTERKPHPCTDTPAPRQQATHSRRAAPMCGG